MVLQNKYKRAASARYQASSVTRPQRPLQEPDPHLPPVEAPTHPGRPRAREDAPYPAKSDARVTCEGEEDIADEVDVEPGERRVYSRRPLQSNASRYREPDEPATLEDESDSDLDSECRSQ